MTLRACRAHLRKRMAQEFEELVETMLCKAMGGSYNHLMLLLEIDGLRPTAKERAEMKKPGRKRRESLEQLLVRALEKRREQREQGAANDLKRGDE